MPTTTQQGLGFHWQRLRPVILRRDRFRCHWCGGRATTVDHLLARAEGGPRYDPANLVAACQPCNSKRGAELAARRNATRRSQPAPTTLARRVWPGAITLHE
jgi:5-methylcytosine-specific restriction endonuclease McrA